jgi:hypothetical protein
MGVKSAIFAMSAKSPVYPCAVKGGALQWVQAPPGKRSSRKQPEQLWR